MESRTDEIRRIAKDLFKENKIDLFIGFEAGTVPLRSRPLFIDAADFTAGGDTAADAAGLQDPAADGALASGTAASAADRLVWDSFCSNNLAAYLQKYYENEPNRRKKRTAAYPRIAVAAKACDLRSIVALTKERQIKRESLTVVGVPCRGMIDKRKVEKAAGSLAAGAAGGPAGEILAHGENPDGTLKVTLRGGKTLSFSREDVLQDCCVECRFPVPEGADIMLSGEARKPGDGGYGRVAEFEKKSSAERWEYFQKELSRCIRCNACRQACPTCWCKECFAEQTDRKWIGVGTEPSDTKFFQIIRIFHQAGRCVECDACYRACPMGIDLRLYTKKIVKDVEEAFGYLPAFDAEALPPLATFSEKDSDSFISDPERKAAHE
jgi:ferredoxin